MKLGEAIYKSQEKKPDSSNDGDKNDEGKKDDNVVDASTTLSSFFPSSFLSPSLDESGFFSWDL